MTAQSFILFTLCTSFAPFALHSDFCKAHFLAILATNCRVAFKNRNLADFCNPLVLSLLKKWAPFLSLENAIFKQKNGEKCDRKGYLLAYKSIAFSLQTLSFKLANPML
ncbi:MAG: hypothetical protein J6W24_01545 [Prevotella sp.]|nr:hypothetical protein [Prevotella sp.]